LKNIKNNDDLEINHISRCQGGSKKMTDFVLLSFFSLDSNQAKKIISEAVKVGSFPTFTACYC